MYLLSSLIWFVGPEAARSVADIGWPVDYWSQASTSFNSVDAASSDRPTAHLELWHRPGQALAPPGLGVLVEFAAGLHWEVRRLSSLLGVEVLAWLKSSAAGVGVAAGLQQRSVSGEQMHLLARCSWYADVANSSQCLRIRHLTRLGVEPVLDCSDCWSKCQALWAAGTFEAGLRYCQTMSWGRQRRSSTASSATNFEHWAVASAENQLIELLFGCSFRYYHCWFADSSC